ncbi:MAG TPA: S8 family serine peptidase [Gemmatimonadales bacterium]|nr:S8 family serine peptidase [Gemmatimonadales bacterium]
MRRFFWIVFLPAGLAAQRPAVSPVLPQLLQRVQDTTVSVWLFARPGVPLDALSDRVTASGARVRVHSRWLNAISADVPSAALRMLLQDRDLRRVQPLGRFRVPADRRRALEVLRSPTGGADTCPAGGDPVYGPSDMPYRRLHLRPLSDRGHRGAGVRVGILDTGFDTQNPAFTTVTVTAQHDFVFNDNVVRDEPGKDVAGAQFHGTAVWSLFAGDVPGRLRGIAPDATYLLAKTEDVRTETRVEEDNYVAALEWADSIGVDIVSSSLAYLIFDNGFSYAPSDLNGDIAVTTVAVDAAARRGIIVVTAAGNEGPGFRTVWTPGDADSALTIGAEDSLGGIAFFSSRGPTADGRLKPDFTAPGVAVCVVTGPGALLREAGTSFATPLTAAGVTLMKELLPTLGPIAMRDTLRAFASHRASPDSTFGWGSPDFAASAGLAPHLNALAPVVSPLTTITPTFSWDAGTLSGSTVTYRLRIARDSSFANVVLDTALGTALSFDLTRPLKGASIFWRVDGRADTGDTASTPRVGPLLVPPWAVLTSLSAPGGAVTDSAQPTFTWDPVAVSSPPGPFTYDLQVQRIVTGLFDFGIAGLRDTSFTLPQPLERNTAYRWILVVHAGSDTSMIRSQGSFLVVDGGMPTSTLLYQNFPNPFPAAGRDSTCLWFDVATTGMVELDILDLRGNHVRHFIPGPDFPAILPAGRYGRGSSGGGGGGGICDPRLMWDGRADDGHPLPAGVYLAKLKAPGLLVFKRIVFRGR